MKQTNIANLSMLLNGVIKHTLLVDEREIELPETMVTKYEQGSVANIHQFTDRQHIVENIGHYIKLTGDDGAEIICRVNDQESEKFYEFLQEHINN